MIAAIRLITSPALWLDIDGRLHTLSSRYGFPMYVATGVRVDTGDCASSGLPYDVRTGALRAP